MLDYNRKSANSESTVVQKLYCSETCCLKGLLFTGLFSQEPEKRTKPFNFSYCFL